jgi:hypothetical protein
MPMTRTLSSIQMRAWFVILVSLVVVIGACSSERSKTRVKPPADLGSVRAGAPFVSSDDGFATSGATFESRVRADGAFEVVPRTTVRGDALTLSTIAIARGGRALDVRGTSFIAEDGVVAIRRGTVLERIENEGGGIEQSWRFDRAPIGEGDLLVRVAARGERFRASTDHGLHFDGTELGLRYGVATWVDARGARTTILPRFVDGAIEMVVPHDVIERSAFPAVLDPTVAAEREIDVPAAVTAAPGDQTYPSIVSLGAGQGYFSIWHDRRSVRPAFVGARIASNGTVTDQTGVTVMSGVASTVSSPSLYASPAGLLLVWSVYNVDEWQVPGIYALRIDATGKALDAAPITVAKIPNPPLATAAFDGTNWLVTWSRYSTSAKSYQISGVRLSGAGAIVDAAPVVLMTGDSSGYSQQLAFDGTNYFLTWIGYTTSYLYAQRIDKDLKPVGAATALLGSYPYDYSLAFDGNQYLLVWYEYVTGYNVSARRFTVNGQANDGGVKLTLATSAQSIGRPRAKWDGTNFFATWVSGYAPYVVQGTRISPAGAVVEATAQTFYSTSNYLYEYAAATDNPGGVVLLREYDQAGSGSDVRGVKVTATASTLTASTPFVVSAASNSETEAATAWNGATYFSVWLDTREKNQTLWGAPISADGTPGTAVRLFANPTGGITFSSMSAPKIATNGSTFLVTFAAAQSGCTGTCLLRSVFAFVIDAQGVLQGAVTDLLPAGGNVTGADVPDVAWNGADYLVVYQEESDGRAIAGRRVHATGVALDDTVLRISPLTPGFEEDRKAPSVAFDGTQYFVAWQTTRPTANNIDVGHIYGTRVSKEGASLDGEIVICNAFLLQGSPRVAAHPRNGFFVVWDDYRTSLDNADVYGGRISSEGQLLDGDKGKAIANGEADESRPTVVAEGEGAAWIVAWRDLRSKEAYDVYGAWVSQGGVNRDPKGFLFSAEAGDEETPALATGPAGKLLLTYARLDPRTGYGSYRLRARSIDGGKPSGQSCANGDDCAARACVDGFCCSTDCDGCGTCSETPGTCTPRAPGTDSPRCNYKCKGTLECPTECAENSDCATGATCDKASKQCVTRQICLDAKTLQDLTGKQTDCAPYTCVVDACRTTCGSVDDCASGFVCDQAGRCLPPPNSGDVSACAAAAVGTGGGSRSRGGFAAAIGALFAIASARRRRAR